MLPFRNSTSGCSALQAEHNRHLETVNELIDKIVALQTDRQLSKEREAALLELLDFYRKQMLQNQGDLKPSNTANESEIPEIVCISPTIANSSHRSRPSNCSYRRRWPSPAPSAASETSIEGDITPYLLEGSKAIRALQRLSASSAVLSLFRTGSEGKSHQTATDNLEQVSDLVSRFASDVASLRGLCVRSQDRLVAGVVESFTNNATATLKKFRDPIEASPGHPMELTLCFHGLLGVLEDLCKQSWCLGQQSEYCIHRLSSGMNELMAVTMVHPGREWKDLQLCLFSGLKGATLLQGDIFGLVGTAHIRERWSYEFFDETSWEEVFWNTNLVDVFWEMPDDDMSEIFIAESEAVCANQNTVETNHFLSSCSDTKDTTSVFSSAFSTFGSETLEHAEDVCMGRELDRGDQLVELKALGQAEAALAELELQVRRRGHPYLRAGEGVNASRRASFITAREAVSHEPEPPRGPYTYLKRGDGMRRRRQVPESGKNRHLSSCS